MEQYVINFDIKELNDFRRAQLALDVEKGKDAFETYNNIRMRIAAYYEYKYSTNNIHIQEVYKL